MSTLLNECREALDRATRNCAIASELTTPMNVRFALMSLLDVCAQLARINGVPNAIEPETGTATVETETKP